MKNYAYGLALAFALTALPARPAHAVPCAIDDVPAATLLLPYFEVDLANRNGRTTVFSVNNAYADPVLAKVEVFSDLGVALFGFHVYLTGYDVEVIDLRDILLYGDFPDTLPAGPLPGGCSQEVLNPPSWPAATRKAFQNALTGLPASTLDGLCAGLAYGDKIARGYVTVDAVNVCTTQYQGSPGYFGPGGTGVPSNANVLWGDFHQVDKNGAYGDTLVHIEAFADEPETSIPGNYTFYGKYVSWTAIDNREPLATTFGARYSNRDPFRGGTDLIVWRDPKVNQSAFTCPAQNGRPAWYPLPYEGGLVFDEEENPSRPLGKVFGAAAQRVSTSSFSPYDAGWAFLNLNHDVAAAGPNPPEDPGAAQAWVMAVSTDRAGRLSVGYDAIQYDSACSVDHLDP
jgi:hypothetical protein